MTEIAEPLRRRRAPRGRRARPAASLRDYVTLTKPRIMSLLVLTSVCAMVAAAGGAPAPLPRWRRWSSAARWRAAARARSTTCSTATSTG